MEGAPESVLPREARTALDALFDHLDALTEKLGVVDHEILAWHKTSEASPRLTTAPGVSPLTARRPDRSGGKRLPVHIGAPFRRVARVDAAHVGEWHARAYRPDQQGRGSLPANTSDPWRPGDGRYERSSRGPTASVASGVDCTSPGQRRRGGGRPQDGARALGHASAGGDISASGGVCASRLTEIGATTFRRRLAREATMMAAPGDRGLAKAPEMMRADVSSFIWTP